MLTVHDLSDAQYKRLCNGCGAKSGPSYWVRPPQGHARIHCDNHDIAYWVGGDEYDRAEADRALFDGMLGDATALRWWQRPGFRIKAWLYYLAVCWAGWAAFHYGEQRNLKDLP